MLKLLKGVFTSKNLTQAHVLTTLGNVVTAVVTFVPAWAPEKQIILASLGGIVSNIYPIVAVVHRAVDALEGLVASHKLTLANVEATAKQLVEGEVGKIDFNKVVSDIENAHGLTPGSIEQIVENKVKSILGQLAAPAPVASSIPATPSPATSVPAGVVTNVGGQS